MINNYIKMNGIKPIDLPTPSYVVQAAWMGVGSQNKLPKNGSWHKWITEVFIFFNVLNKNL